MNLLSSVIAIILLFIAVVFMVYLWWFLFSIKKKLKKLKDYEVKFDYHRELMERKVYQANEKLLLSPDNYNDVFQSYIQRDDKDIILTQCVVDEKRFFNSLGIDLSKYEVKKGQATCLMPFHKDFDHIYTCLKEAGKQKGYEIVRSDNEFKLGDIFKYTIELILQSELIISVMDGRNPNVFYEMGIADAIGKPILLISNVSSFENIPFDVKSNRIILYKDVDELRSKIINVIENVSRDE